MYFQGHVEKVGLVVLTSGTLIDPLLAFSAP